MITDFCVVCGTKECLENHHIVPRSLGGLDNPENLLTLCHVHHREMHGIQAKSNVNMAELTKVALGKLKAQGIKLGPKYKKLTAADSDPYRKMWVAEEKRRAQEFAEKVYQVIKELRDKGLTNSQVAKELNAKNYPTYTGKGQWHTTTVQRCVARVQKITIC